MLYIKYTNYRNDFDRNCGTAQFASLDSLKNYLIKQNEARDTTPKWSKYWSNPAGVDHKIQHGWFQTSRTGDSYSFWLEEVKTDNGVIVFENGHYCSPKFMIFLEELEAEIGKKPVYGDL